MPLRWQGKLDPGSPSLLAHCVDHDDWLHGQCGGWESVVRHATDRFWKLPSFVEHVVNGRNVPRSVDDHAVTA